MKKFLLIAVAAFGMLMTACSKDEVAQPVVEESTVTFTISTPELATRAHGDGLTATVLKYAVYNRADGSKLFEGQPETITNKTATVEIPFVNGMEYDVLFWADAPASPYTVDWAAKTVAYTDATALVGNSEAYDAFYAYVNDIPEITGPVTKTVELKRPFAQLNIITNDATEAAKSGVTVKDVKVVVEGAYTDFDLANHKGLTEGTVTFGTAAAQTTTDVLAVNYLFPAAEKSLVDVEFTYTDVNGKLAAAGEVKEFATVPVQRNYKTNIIGSLLTSDGQFAVEIKEGFDGTNGVDIETGITEIDGKQYKAGSTMYKKADGTWAEATTLATAISAAPAGSVITLGEGVDVTLSATATTAINKNLTISGISPEVSKVTGAIAPTAAYVSGGYTAPKVALENVTFVWNGVGEGAFVIKGEGKPEISLKNCVIDANGTNPSGTNGVITLQKVFKVNIENCTFDGNSGTSWAISQTIAGTASEYATITNCTFNGGGILLTTGNGNVEYLKIQGNTFNAYRGLQIDDVNPSNKWQYLWIENNTGTLLKWNWTANTKAENVYVKGNKTRTGGNWSLTTTVLGKVNTEY